MREKFQQLFDVSFGTTLVPLLHDNHWYLVELKKNDRVIGVYDSFEGFNKITERKNVGKWLRLACAGIMNEDPKQ